MTSPTPKPRAGEHTKGPWRIDHLHSRDVVAPDEGVIAISDIPDNAQRIVACVNACEGIVGELPNMLGLLDTIDRIITERDLLRERERALVMERDQQERFKWAGNKRIEELAAVLKQVADRLSAWRDGAHIAFNASGSDEQYNLRGNYDGLLSAIEAVMVETTTPHGR